MTATANEWNHTLRVIMGFFQAGEYRPALEMLLAFGPAGEHENNRFYLIGQCHRFLGDFPAAVKYHRKALALSGGQDTPVLHALGIALQHNGDADEAIEAFKSAVAVDPDFDQAYNSLGYACHKSGRYDDALRLYHHALQAMSRRIVKGLRNSPENPILDHRLTRGMKWAEYAAYAAAVLATRDDAVHRFSLPTGFSAVADEAARVHGGLLYLDTAEGDAVCRCILPNFFATFQNLLFIEGAYALFLGNMGLAYNELGERDRADAYLSEAEEFAGVS